MVFSPKGATSIDLVTRDLLRTGGYGEGGFAIGRAVENPFDDVDFRAINSDRKGSILESVASLIRDEKPDAVVVHQHPESAAKLAKMLPSTPVILHRHGLLRHKKGLLSNWRKGRQFSTLAGIIFVSGFLRQRFIESYPQFISKSHVVWNGIDTDFWRPNESKEQTIAFVGRARKDKGIGELIAAFRALNMPDWDLHLGLAVQTAEERFYADKILSDTGANPNIKASLNLTSVEVRDLLARSAIAALPSIVEEGFHRAVIEAMACGCVTIATNRGGTPEAAGEAGILLPDVDAHELVKSLSTTLRTIVIDQALAKKYEKLSRTHASLNSNLHSASSKHLKVLKEILQQ